MVFIDMMRPLFAN